MVVKFTLNCVLSNVMKGPRNLADSFAQVSKISLKFLTWP